MPARSRSRPDKRQRRLSLPPNPNLPSRAGTSTSAPDSTYRAQDQLLSRTRPTVTHLQVPLRGTCPVSRAARIVRISITALGGSRQSVRRIVAGIVDYLIEPNQSARSASNEAALPLGSGSTSYYADRGDEPGRWLGRGAADIGLRGRVDRDDFSSVLSGRDPTTGERLITARGSSGRRPKLGVGSLTRWDDQGEPLYDVTDSAAVLGIEESDAEQLIDAGVRVAASRLFGWISGTGPAETGNGEPKVGKDDADAEIGAFAAPAYLLPVVAEGGARWVSEAELSRHEDAMAIGVTSDEVTAGGHPDDLLSMRQAAELVGVIPRYLRRVARRYEKDRADIDELLTAGRQPRRAYLIAQRGPRQRWFVTRRNLADFVARREPPAVRVAFDATLTTEKSLSVFALLAEPEHGRQVLDAIQLANDRAMRWLEKSAAEARVEGEIVSVDGWTVASFRHLTSRALDPFAHHHNVIANTVIDGSGNRRALDARGLYRCSKAAAALATADARWHITKSLCVRWRPGRSGSWEIDGITEDVLTAFSQRRNEMDDALKELEAEIGRGARPDEVDHIAVTTRPRKQAAAVEDLQADWWRRADTVGLTRRNLAACMNQSTPVTADPEAVFARLAAPNGICEKNSVFNFGELLDTLISMPIPQPDGSDPQPLLLSAEPMEQLAQDFLHSRHVVALTAHEDVTRCAFTTTEILSVQERIVKRYRRGLQDLHAPRVWKGVLDDALSQHSHLTDEQRELVAGFCTSGLRIQCGIGRAGAGKTTAMRAVADAWRAADFRVVGTAVQGEAARLLGDATGIRSETLAWWLAHTDPGTASLDARTVMIVDEASTVSDRDLDRLGWLAEQTGATLRLIGDPAQHSSVEAGGMFRVLCETNRTYTPELTQNLRLKDPRDRAAADALRDGRINDALDSLDLAGHLHIVDDELDFYRQILTRWWQSRSAGQGHPMVDRRNAVRHRLNRIAHRLLAAQGEVGSEEIASAGDRRFAVGDSVIARAPDRSLHAAGDKSAYVRNAATGTVVALRRSSGLRDDSITVDFDGIGRITLPRAYFDEHELVSGEIDVGLDHAYAVTSHAVQGSTRGVSASRIDEHSNRTEAYVDITRGRDANHLYLTRTRDPLDDDELPRVPAPPIDAEVSSRLSRSTGEKTAWEIHQRRTGGERRPPDHAALTV